MGPVTVKQSDYSTGPTCTNVEHCFTFRVAVQYNIVIFLMNKFIFVFHSMFEEQFLTILQLFYMNRFSIKSSFKGNNDDYVMCLFSENNI